MTGARRFPEWRSVDRPPEGPAGWLHRTVHRCRRREVLQRTTTNCRTADTVRPRGAPTAQRKRSRRRPGSGWDSRQVFSMQSSSGVVETQVAWLWTGCGLPAIPGRWNQGCTDLAQISGYLSAMLLINTSLPDTRVCFGCGRVLQPYSAVLPDQAGRWVKGAGNGKDSGQCAGRSVLG